MRTFALAALGAAVLAGCSLSGNQGLLSSTCDDFMAADDQKQMETAAQWANPDQDGSTTDASKFMALGVRASLIRYCSQDGHGDDEIGDLEIAV